LNIALEIYSFSPK